MIRINIDKAKTIAHDLRRIKRSEEFAPLDAQIAKQIPGTNLHAVEAQRQSVRDKYAAMQKRIESANSPDEIKAALEAA